MTTIQVRGIEFDNANDALQETNASGRGQVILVGGKYLVVEPAEAERLETAGLPFAHVCDHEMPDGSFRIVTIPVND